MQQTSRTPFYHPRTALARGYCDALEGVGILDATSGLFLAGRRRTGKSSFLRRDLIPEMLHRGWVPIYVDLWEQRPRSPADLIEEVLHDKLAEVSQTFAGRQARKAGLERVGIPGLVSMDLDRSHARGHTIARIVATIVERTGRPVALLVDEAQYALGSDDGVQVMFALKAARDRLNQSDAGQRLHLVLTGSSRDKLAHLLLRKNEPFYGASITAMPTLDRAFVHGYTEWINRRLADDRRFSVAAMERAFDIVGRRPELLRQVAGQTIANEGDPRALDSILNDDVERFRRLAWQEFESDHAQLTWSQRAVLDAMVRLLPSFEPFSEAAHAAYEAVLGQPLPSSTAQSSLDALRERGIVWRAGRGNYALEDDDLRAWYLTLYPVPPRMDRVGADGAGQVEPGSSSVASARTPSTHEPSANGAPRAPVKGTRVQRAVRNRPGAVPAPGLAQGAMHPPAVQGDAHDPPGADDG